MPLETLGTISRSFQVPTWLLKAFWLLRGPSGLQVSFWLAVRSSNQVGLGKDRYLTSVPRLTNASLFDIEEAASHAYEAMYSSLA